MDVEVAALRHAVKERAQLRIVGPSRFEPVSGDNGVELTREESEARDDDDDDQERMTAMTIRRRKTRPAALDWRARS
jgi:hypothetical protein